MAIKAKSMYEEAVADVESLKKAAEENAKNYLVEALAPRIKDFISSHMGQEGLDAAVALDAQGQIGSETMPNEAPEDGMYEIEDAKDDDDEVPELDLDGDADAGGDDELDDLPDDFGGDDEDEDDEDDDELSIDIKKDEGTDHDMEDDKEPAEESVEITSEDLRKAFAGVLKGLRNEASLSPGKLGEPDDPNEGDVGLGGKVERDKQWAEVVPQKTKMHAKEAKEFAALRKELKQYKEAYAYLKKNLQEMNLFNAKLIYTTRLLQNNLSPKQKLSVVESIDCAKNKSEVELVFKTLSESFKIAGVVNEGKKAGLKGPKGSRVARPSSTLNEGFNKAQDEQLDRMSLLAGLTK